MLDEENHCPCTVIASPCISACSCAQPFMSGGCRNCDRFGKRPDSYETMRNDWLNARLLPPEGHPNRRKDDGHYFNLGMFDDIYKLGAEQQNKTLKEALDNIRTNEGMVCNEYDTCQHSSCRSSHTSWAIAHNALQPTELGEVDCKHD